MTTLFTKIINRDIPAYIIYEDDTVCAFLDISQGTPGHTLVVPKEVTASFLTASPETLKAVTIAARHVAETLIAKLGAKGVNILTNASETAGQTVPHYHVHIIPRYAQDELSFNFKTHSQTLEDIYKTIMQ